MKFWGLLSYGLGISDIAAACIEDDWGLFLVGLFSLIIGAAVIDLGGD